MKTIKYIFDRVTALIGLLFLWPALLIVAILIKCRMPGPVFFVQQRVGKDGKLFHCHKFRSMTVGHNGSSVSVAGEARITPLGAKLRRYKLDELPELWDVFIGNISASTWTNTRRPACRQTLILLGLERVRCWGSPRLAATITTLSKGKSFLPA